MTVSRPVMRYRGAKFRLAEWVMGFFPDHRRYIEPFGGAAGILMRKPRSYGEVYNELDPEISNVFRVLRDPDQAIQLDKLCRQTPYSRIEFDCAFEPAPDPVEQARRTLYRAASGFGSAGATKNRTGFRSDSGRLYSLSAHNWANYPDYIESFTKRLSGVIIESRPAVDVIEAHDGDDALIYCDPPYMPETRSDRGVGLYRCELDEHGHEVLLTKLKGCRSYVVLSGYESELYLDLLSDWVLHKTHSRISAGRGTAVKTECLWLNPRCADAQPQQELFA